MMGQFIETIIIEMLNGFNCEICQNTQTTLSSKISIDMSNSRYCYPIQIRFCDIDSLGHVNNAHYLSYFEMARVLFMNEHIGQNWDWINKGMVLKQNTVEYLAPVYLGESVEIEIVPVNCGNTSFTLDYLLFANGKLKCKGSSVLVCFDFAKKQKNEVYEEFKNMFKTV